MILLAKPRGPQFISGAASGYATRVRLNRGSRLHAFRDFKASIAAASADQLLRSLLPLLF